MDKRDEQAETPRQPWISSRRNLLATGAAAGIAGILGTPPAAAAPIAAPIQDKPQTVPEANVRNFGARGDATADDTAAFQRALDSVHSAGGGTVYAAPGSYLFRGVLNIPEGVTLRALLRQRLGRGVRDLRMSE